MLCLASSRSVISNTALDNTQPGGRMLWLCCAPEPQPPITMRYGCALPRIPHVTYPTQCEHIYDPDIGSRYAIKASSARSTRSSIQRSTCVGVVACAAAGKTDLRLMGLQPQKFSNHIECSKASSRRIRTCKHFSISV
jgi:hypothetical protein